MENGLYVSWCFGQKKAELLNLRTVRMGNGFEVAFKRQKSKYQLRQCNLDGLLTVNWHFLKPEVFGGNYNGGVAYLKDTGWNNKGEPC